MGETRGTGERSERGYFLPLLRGGKVGSRWWRGGMSGTRERGETLLFLPWFRGGKVGSR